MTRALVVSDSHGYAAGLRMIAEDARRRFGQIQCPCTVGRQGGTDGQGEQGFPKLWWVAAGHGCSFGGR